MSVHDTLIHNLPLLPTSFVGRKLEIADIVNRLQDQNCRLLTLVGSGGIGKTRLAIECISHLNESDFEHGIFYVPLAPLTSAENIMTTIINVLGIHIGDDSAPRETLVKFLSQRNLLLVMDNFEHVLEGSDIVTDILGSASDVKVLVTSREILNLSMEFIWHVRGMGYPDSDEPDDINQYDALNLFIERALQTRRDFSLAGNQIDIIQICKLLDGLPLAIELAASWLKTLSCHDIIKQIERGIDFLATRHRDIPARHRNIRAVFDHSWNLLSADEQAVFPRLSVFRGGFMLEAAAYVAEADLTTLSGLVEKSMVRRGVDGRYDIHELLRQYGEKYLLNLNDRDRINKNHLTYFSDFVMRHVPDLQGGRQLAAIEEIRADFGNILSAWQMACKNLSTDKIYQMLECINLFYEVIGYLTSVNEMYAYAIKCLEPIPDTDSGLKNRLQVFALYMHHRQHHMATFEQKREVFSPLLHASEHYNDELAILMCLIMLISPQIDEQSDQMQRMLDLGEHLGEYYLALVLDQLCHHNLLEKNENSQATRSYLTRFLSVTQGMQDIDGTATAYHYLAQYERFWGNIEDALDYYDKAITGYQRTNNQYSVAINQGLKLLIMFKMGDFEYVSRVLLQVIDQLTEVAYFTNHVYLYMMLSKTEALLGYYERSQEYFDHMQRFPSIKRPRVVFHIIEAQAMIAIGLSNFEGLRQKLTEALQIDTSVISPRLMIDFLPLVAFLYYHDRQYVRAVELLGLAFTHPLAVTGWMENWELLSQLRATLQHMLGDFAYQTTWEGGTQVDVLETITDIRAYLGIESSAQISPQPLIEPLTKRELDVLELLGDGYSNPEIANQLFVTVGTIKAHAHNIFQKLNVNNRTQAVLKAKKIGLL